MTTPLRANPIVLEVGPEGLDQRLDQFLVRQFPELSRTSLRKSIDAGGVLIDQQPAKASTRLRPGQVVSLTLVQRHADGPAPEAIALQVLFEDDDLIGVDKPAGMVVHPAKGHWQGTLASALAHHCQILSTIGGATRPGIVHRLDRDTSGVILAAKTDAAHLALAEQFANRSVEKEYLAIVRGTPDRDRDVIDCAIGPHPYQREKMAIRKSHVMSRAAVTEYEVLERWKGFAFLKIHPRTGRTHQIRVHLAHAGLPIVADRLYAGHSKLFQRDLPGHPARDTGYPGGDTILIDRQALHAARIAFAHPSTQQRLELQARVPDDIAKVLSYLRGDPDADLR